MMKKKVTKCDIICMGRPGKTRVMKFVMKGHFGSVAYMYKMEFGIERVQKLKKP